MQYETALSRAWSELANLAQEKNYSIRLLADNYTVDLENRRVLSASCNAPAKPSYNILILHYLIQKLKQGLPAIKGEWISFKELAGGQGYYPAFKKRVIDAIMKKYSANPQALLELTERLPAKRTQLADISIVLDVFEQVPILITFWRGDDEFAPGVNVLFDKSIRDIFCTEDIVVLAEIMAHNT